MRFTIRDLLWLMVVTALTVSWWIDNQRIEKGVAKLENDHRLMQADFQDKMTILDEMQKERGRRVREAILNRVPIPRHDQQGSD